jgi:hypothetical protein
LVAVLLLAQQQSVDLSVSFQTAPATGSVGAQTAYVVQAAGNGATGVYVTVVFVSPTAPPVTFNAGGSSNGCTANAASTDPSTTVTCPWSGSALTINITPQVAGTLKAVAGVIGNQYDPLMSNNSMTATTTVSASASTPAATIFTIQVPGTNTNTGGHEIGTRFTSSQAGAIVALRFWKAPADTGSHTVRLWNDTGTQLTSLAFAANDSASGWQEQLLPTSVAISAGVYYRVSYNVSTGYSYTSGGIPSSITNGPLTALSGCYNQVGGNFPNNIITNNYFADVRFKP